MLLLYNWKPMGGKSLHYPDMMEDCNHVPIVLPISFRLQQYSTRQLLVQLPSTFVGLESDHLFERLADNAYCPSSPYLLQVIIHLLMTYWTKLRQAHYLFRCWVDGFYLYRRFRGDAMEGWDPATVKYLQEKFVQRYARELNNSN
jgi:hypothetical protein